MPLVDCIVATSIGLRLPLKGELFVRVHWQFVALVTSIIDPGLPRNNTANSYLRIQIRQCEYDLRLTS